MNTIKLNTIGTPKASGGNGGGGIVDSSSKNFIQYFKVPKGWNKATFARMYGVILKVEINGNLSIYPTNMVNNAADSSMVAYGIMPNLPISASDTSAKNLKEYVDILQPMLFTQTEITEEEFYTV